MAEVEKWGEETRQVGSEPSGQALQDTLYPVGYVQPLKCVQEGSGREQY